MTISGQHPMFGVEWIDDDTLVVAYTPEANSISRLGTVEIGDGSLVPLPSTLAPQCEQVALANPVRIADDRLALTQECIAPLGTGIPDRSTILTLDVAGQTYGPLASTGDVRGPAGQLTLDPDGTRALVAMSSLCGVIVEATATGPKPLTAVVSDGADSFPLDDIAPGPDCAQRDWADYPSWSPVADEIAFFAAPKATGRDGPDRGLVPADLFVMTPDSDTTKSILGNVSVPRALRFSPDGKCLAFGGTIDSEVATWVMNRETGNLRRVHDRFDWLAWSPDGSRLAGSGGVDPSKPLDHQIVIVPLGC